MTCIVGIKAEGRVLIGGDSAGASGYVLQHRTDTKVFRTGDWVMGFTSSFRMGQLIRHAWVPPVLDTWDMDRFMVTRFIEGLREVLRVGGWMEKHSEREDGGSFLVANGEHLYAVFDDLQIARVSDDYMAVGCGQDYAMGSLHTTRPERCPEWATDLLPADRMALALDAAAHHSGWVIPPYTIEETTAA